MDYSMQAKFGLSLSNRAPLFNWATTDDLIEAAKVAEDSGYFHGVWVGDNLLSRPRLDAVVTLSAVAAATRRVKLGTICLASFPMRHPIALAIQWATLDVVSGGRTILGACNGGGANEGQQHANELTAMGIKSAQRVGRVEEGITILRRLWSEQKVTHQGKYYQFSDVEALPKPVQQHIPIHIGVTPNVDAALRRVARYADGWQIPAIEPPAFRKGFDTIKEYAAQLGRDPSKLDSCYHMMVNINEDKEKGFREAEEFLSLYYYGRVTRERMETWVAHGSPQAVAERIKQYVDAGCTMPVLRFASRNFKEQLRRCIEEVLPAFRMFPAQEPVDRR